MQKNFKMIQNRTFTMIKPDAVANGHIGGILEKVTAAGFKIVAMKYTQLSLRDAKAFYAVHSERPFFGELVEFMSSGPIVAAILEKDNAVEDFRALIALQILKKQQKVRLEKYMQPLLEKMLFTDLIVMRTQPLKVLFTLLEERFSKQYINTIAYY